MDVSMYGCVHTNFKGAKTEARSKKQATESNTQQATSNKQQTRKVKINTVLCYHTHSQVFVELALLIGVDSTGCLVKYSELRAVEVQPRLGRSANDQPKKWGDRTREKYTQKVLRGAASTATEMGSAYIQHSAIQTGTKKVKHGNN